MNVRACLAISSFRYDAAVLRLLEHAAADGALDLFDRVIVVDSIGTGAMPDALRDRYGDRVEYHCASSNLGSAGNLAQRLTRAAAGPYDVVYAVNHDGSVERATVERLLAAAARTPGFGALYPLRRMTSRGGGYDVTGRWSIPVPMRVVDAPPSESLVPVWWGSSNPALYALAPVRAGLLPWADLWLGWEDLGYGWVLAQNHYPQFIVTDAITDDGYELRPVLGSVHVSDKPTWYAYYVSRNLVLIAKRTRPGAARSAAVAMRLALEMGVTLAVRKDKHTHLQYLTHKITNKLQNHISKWHLP